MVNRFLKSKANKSPKSAFHKTKLLDRNSLTTWWLFRSEYMYTKLHRVKVFIQSNVVTKMLYLYFSKSTHIYVNFFSVQEHRLIPCVYDVYMSMVFICLYHTIFNQINPLLPKSAKIIPFYIPQIQSNTCPPPPSPNCVTSL